MIDRIDRALLELLQRDAALSLDELGQRAGLSRNACWRRIRRLEEAGVIRARVALLDPAALNVGLTAFIAVRTSQHTTEWLERFSGAVRDIPEIVAVYRMTGDVDYLLRAVVPDVAAYDRLYRRLIARIALSDVSSSFVMEEIKATTVLPLDYAEGKPPSGPDRGSPASVR